MSKNRRKFALKRRATVVDANFVKYKGKQWRYNEWGTVVTGWSAINIYREVILAQTGQTLDALRKQLRGERVEIVSRIPGSVPHPW